ncbi:hypothetical protein P7C70_g7124, partial [Phenoliferia sp. Uapishka_3]
MPKRQLVRQELPSPIALPNLVVRTPTHPLAQAEPHITTHRRFIASSGSLSPLSSISSESRSSSSESESSAPIRPVPSRPFPQRRATAPAAVYYDQSENWGAERGTEHDEAERFRTPSPIANQQQHPWAPPPRPSAPTPFVPIPPTLPFIPRPSRHSQLQDSPTPTRNHKFSHAMSGRREAGQVTPSNPYLANRQQYQQYSESPSPPIATNHRQKYQYIEQDHSYQPSSNHSTATISGSPSPPVTVSHRQQHPHFQTNHPHQPQDIQRQQLLQDHHSEIKHQSHPLQQPPSTRQVQQNISNSAIFEHVMEFEVGHPKLHTPSFVILPDFLFWFVSGHLRLCLPQVSGRPTHNRTGSPPSQSKPTSDLSSSMQLGTIQSTSATNKVRSRSRRATLGIRRGAGLRVSIGKDRGVDSLSGKGERRPGKRWW